MVQTHCVLFAFPLFVLPLLLFFLPLLLAAPPSIREAYEKFLLAVGTLVGGELSSSELHEAAALAYQALEGHLGSGSRSQRDEESGPSTSGQLDRVRYGDVHLSVHVHVVL